MGALVVVNDLAFEKSDVHSTGEQSSFRCLVWEGRRNIQSVCLIETNKLTNLHFMYYRNNRQSLVFNLGGLLSFLKRESNVYKLEGCSGFNSQSSFNKTFL